MERIAPYWKAVLAFIAPGAVTIGSAVTTASDGGSAITTAEWVTAAVACIVTSAAVYAVPNGLTTEQRRTTAARVAGKNEHGATDWFAVAVVVLLVLILLAVLGVLNL